MSKKRLKKELKKKRQAQGDASNDNFMGPWASYEGQEFTNQVSEGPSKEE